MSGLMKWGQRASQVLVGVAMVAAAAPSWAAIVESDYLTVNYSSVPSRLSLNWTFDVQGPTLNWQCSGTAAGDCTYTGSMIASVLIKPVAGQSSASDTFSFHALRFQVDHFNRSADGTSLVVPLVDPNGHTVDYLQADIGKWTLTASGRIGGVPANPLFMTAYGSNALTVRTGYYPPVIAGAQNQLIGETTTQLSSSLGPGGAGQSNELEWFSINQDLITPYLAYPSTTNPRCKDLSCLDYAAGVYTPDAFVLSFQLVSVPAPAVPEPSAAMLALAGLGALAYAARRRNA